MRPTASSSARRPSDRTDAEPVLLIAGAASSMLYWDDEFCARLAAGPRFVLRYDHRDTGRSVDQPAGRARLHPVDLLDDAIGLLDAFGIERAHLVGLSMGGGLAQLAAITHPRRVASLTLIATSPAGPSAHSDLPSMSERGAGRVRGGGSSRTGPTGTAVLDYLVEQERLCAARSVPFDAAGMRAAMARVLDRSPGVRSMFNHFLVLGGDAPRHRLAEIARAHPGAARRRRPALPAGARCRAGRGDSRCPAGRAAAGRARVAAAGLDGGPAGDPGSHGRVSPCLSRRLSRRTGVGRSTAAAAGRAGAGDPPCLARLHPARWPARLLRQAGEPGADPGQQRGAPAHRVVPPTGRPAGTAGTSRAPPASAPAPAPSAGCGDPPTAARPVPTSGPAPGRPGCSRPRAPR